MRLSKLKTSHRFVCLTLQVAIAVSAFAQTATTTRTPNNLNASSARISKAYANLGRFSGSVLVAKDGGVVFSEGYGLANIESATKNTTKTRFHLGSLSKQFTAAAILKLESEGRLSTADPISKFLSDYPKPQADTITIHHLLDHTSGIPSLGQRSGIPDPADRSKPVTLTDLIALFKDLPLQFTPGTKYRYNNSGYILLAAIIEKASGQAYDSYLTVKLFAPASMRSTGRIPDEKTTRNVAIGYMGYAPDLVKPTYVHPSWFIGGAGIYSTVEDLFRWDQALYNNAILPPAQLDKFFKAHVERGRPGRHYAYGWFIDEVHGRLAINHGGTTEGFVCAYYRFPQDKLLVVVLSNYVPKIGIDIPDQVATRLSAAAFGVNYELPPEVVKLPASELRDFVGEYEFDPGYRLKVELRNGQLIAKTAGAQNWTLATYSQQAKLATDKSRIDKARRIVAAFVAGDHQVISELAAPARRSEITAASVNATRNEIAAKWGRLQTITPFAVSKDGSVRNRLSFEKGEMFMMIEFNEKEEFVGWFYGNRMMPAEVPLLPTSPNSFYVDGFKYDEGAPWGEKPVFVEFSSAGVTIKQGTDVSTARKIVIL